MGMYTQVRGWLNIDSIGWDEARIVKAEQLLKQACILVQDDAKRNCPVYTGRLQGSIQYEVKEDDADKV